MSGQTLDVQAECTSMYLEINGRRVNCINCRIPTVGTILWSILCICCTPYHIYEMLLNNVCGMMIPVRTDIGHGLFVDMSICSLFKPRSCHTASESKVSQHI